MADTGWITGDAMWITRGMHAEWTIWNNAEAQDDAYAGNFCAKEDVSGWLRMTDFGFGGLIPVGSAIIGIEVRLDRYAITVNVIHDSSLRLVLTGVAGGDDKASGTFWLTVDNDTYIVYGGPLDMWTSGYDRADVIDADFGWQISLYNVDPDFSQQAYVDHMQMKIYYAPPYPNAVNDIPTANIGSINDVPTTDIETVNEV